MIFIDSNVFIDVLDDTQRWADWSKRAFHAALAAGDCVLNPIVLAELARRFVSADEQLIYFGALGLTTLPLTPEVAFRAGHAHAAYRDAGGERQAILADFLIGAHAQTLGATLLTRDRRRFARYFPELTLITPSDIDHG